MMEYIKHRSALRRTRDAVEKGELTVGMIGGSITDARVRHNWPEHITAWLADQKPELRLCVENAAIGATGSDLAVFRAERDLISRACDLVFVEFAVNDLTEQSEKRMRSREGLLRKLLAADMDVILIYTHAPEMLVDLQEERVPQSILEFEELAEYYEITSVWVGRYAWDLVRRGIARYDQWLPDGLHPQYYGSSLYAEPIIDLLRTELFGTVKIPEKRTLKPARNNKNWQDASILPWNQVAWDGPWQLQASYNWPWVDYVLHTHADGAHMRFSFSGRGFALFYDFGLLAAAYDISVDCQPSVRVRFDYESWCGESG